ncbi:MAG: electron transfer flavoprotein subunit beta/FixA family protein [Deltaproteobacteria bacterium]|nr:MAG: electron transfer flavoprotein subunit beta/FixA family protein [Deltaproteobacteria bacterium]
MKVLVTVKRVTDPDVKIKVKPDGSGVVTEGIDFKVNPFDEIAVEEALRIKEKLGGEVVVASIGPQDATKEIRSALAMGAERGILVKTDQPLDPYVVAQVLVKLVEEEKPDLILMGKQAVDGDNNQTGQMLAEMLGVGQACFASKVEISEDGKKATVTREVDGGFDVVELDLPAVITADLRLNEPRYASLPGIMKAKKKPIKEMELGELGVDANPRVVWHKFSEPPARKAGIKVPDVPTLVAKLRDEAKVI